VQTVAAPSTSSTIVFDVEEAIFKIVPRTPIAAVGVMIE